MVPACHSGDTQTGFAEEYYVVNLDKERGINSWAKLIVNYWNGMDLSSHLLAKTVFTGAFVKLS